MRLVLAGICSASLGLGQYVLEPDKIQSAAQFFTPDSDEQHLACKVIPLQPHLSFIFRIQTGYAVRVPLKQFSGAGHRWVVLTRVVPESGGEPTYLVSRWSLPAIPKTKREVEIGGMFLVGEGHYRVDWILGDDRNRYCRKSWSIDAKLKSDERGTNIGLAPGSVSELSLRRWSSLGNQSDDAHPIRRLTVLLHAAPLVSRRTRLAAQDRGILLGSLVSLLETLPAQSVRLVVFNLDQQKELFRQDIMTPEAFESVAESMRNLQLQLVNYQVLQNRLGHIRLLTDLLNNEIHAAAPSDAVIVLGPTARFADPVPDIPLEENMPRMFYLQFKPDWDRGQDFPDSIDFAMKKLRGKTLIVHNPDDYAKAIRQIEMQLSGDKRAGVDHSTGR